MRNGSLKFKIVTTALGAVCIFAAGVMMASAFILGVAVGLHPLTLGNLVVCLLLLGGAWFWSDVSAHRLVLEFGTDGGVRPIERIVYAKPVRAWLSTRLGVVVGEDPMRRFLTERCELSPDAATEVLEVWVAWKAFCRTNGIHEGSISAMGKRLARVAGEAIQIAARPNSRVRFYKGLRVKHPELAARVRLDIESNHAHLSKLKRACVQV